MVIIPTFSRSAVSSTTRGSNLVRSYSTTVCPERTAAKAVHMPAACIIGDTANHGGPACCTLAWISAAASWSAPFMLTTYVSACRHITPLGLPVVPPVQIISRSSGDGLMA